MWFLFLIFLRFIYLFEREREKERTEEGQRERILEQTLLSGKPGAKWGSIPDQNLSQNQEPAG